MGRWYGGYLKEGNWDAPHRPNPRRSWGRSTLSTSRSRKSSSNPDIAIGHRATHQSPTIHWQEFRTRESGNASPLAEGASLPVKTSLGLLPIMNRRRRSPASWTLGDGLLCNRMPEMDVERCVMVLCDGLLYDGRQDASDGT